MGKGSRSDRGHHIVKNKCLPLLQIGIPAGLGVNLTFTLLYFFQEHAGRSARQVILWTALGVLICAGLYFLTAAVITPWFKKISKTEKTAYLLLTLLAGFYFIAALPVSIPSNTIFLPEKKLIVFASGDHAPSSGGSEVQLTGFFNGINFVSYNDMKEEGKWVRGEFTITSAEQFPSSLTWKGKIYKKGYLEFATQLSGGVVRVTWDGMERVYDLYSPQPEKLQVELDNPPSIFFSTILPLFLTGISLSLVFFLAVILLTTLQGHLTPERPMPGSYWLLYSLPMVLCWSIWLMAFFPGLMSDDSVNQWMQVVREEFNDWHPVAHTLLIWLLTRVWFSPAVLPVFQIAVVSLVAARALGLANQWGAGRWITWLASLAIALMPVNSTFVISLWKDVLYSAALLGLTLELFQVVFTSGRWLNRKRNLVLFTLTLLGVSLFRHNGLPVVILVPLGLIIFFRNCRKKVFLITAVIFSIYFLVRGPLYTQLEVQKKSSVLGETVLLHQVGAHVNNHTPLSTDQTAYLDSLLPLENWNYRCFSVNNLFYNKDFRQDIFAQNSQKTWDVFLFTLRQDPMVNLRHLVCSSSLVWRFFTWKDSYENLASINEVDGNLKWISEPQVRSDDLTWIPGSKDILSLGLIQDSKIPGLTYPLWNFINLTTANLISVAFLWRPAMFLYNALTVVTLLAVRLRSWKMLFVATPLVIHTVFLGLTVVSQDIRYQYAAILIGLTMIPFFFIHNPTIENLDSGQ